MSATTSGLSQFLQDLSERRERLLDLVQSEDQQQLALVDELNELSEQLIVADEELRAQQEELDQAREHLASLVAERELLFSAFPHALVVTDEHGTVQRTTQAADRLALRQASLTRPHPIAVWFDVPDRKTIRSMITRRHNGLQRPERARLRRADGTTRPVLVTVSPTEKPDGSGELLHWQLVDLVHENVSGVGGEAALLDLAGTLTDLAVRLEQATDAHHMLEQVAALVLRLVPEAEHVEVVLGAPSRRAPATALRAAGGNVLVVPLPPLARLHGELVLYGKAASRLPASAEPLASLVAAHAGTALARRMDEDNLRRAVESHRQVGEAVGILVERHRLTSEAAFGRLVRVSQNSHVKLRDVARQVRESGLDPEHLPER